VHEQHARTMEIDERVLFEQLAAAFGTEARTDEEIAVCRA
jgi:hypothetical protein